METTIAARPHPPGPTDRTTRLARWLRAPVPPLAATGERAVLFAAFALLVALRLPRAWAHGRFLDEEGTIFFAFAWHRPAITAPFRPFGGYLNLAANATTLLDARLVRWGVVSLEHAPYLTMAAAWLVQLLPALLLLTGRADWLNRRGALWASLLFVVASPWTEEVFLNVLHIQFHLALCVALILALDVPRGRAGQAGCGVILLLAPLCGPGAIVLLPLFGLRAVVDRSWSRAGQTAAFALGTAIQLLVFFTPSPVRGQFLGLPVLAAVLFVRLVVDPFLGPPLANVVGRAVYRSHAAGGAGWWCAAAAAAGWFGTLAALALRRWRRPAIWPIASGLAIAAISFGGGMIASDAREWFSVGAGERYMFLPLVLEGIGLVALAAQSAGRLRHACIALCGAALTWGVIFYPLPLGELSRGADWPGEVARWRQDHRYEPRSWPDIWTVDLSDTDRPCSPPGTARAAARDPGYCESSWLAKVAPRAPVAAGRPR